ncbi:MAG: caspase family protein [Acidobacteriota bacterium]|nr:MAG: caspase family protein [Acidobacteriota bacterium]
MYDNTGKSIFSNFRIARSRDVFRRPPIAALFLLAVVLSPISAPKSKVSAAGRTHEKPQLKLALLVGVSKYKSANWRNLSGPENDVRILRDLLKDPLFGFREDLQSNENGSCGSQKPGSDIRTLCSEQATRQAILAAFDRHLIAKAKEFAEKSDRSPEDGAVVVFSFSGHGSFVKDKNGDEPDGMDETLVPHDAGSNGENEIVDDEIRARIDELRKYTTNITFISDSCHSGSITRGYAARGGRNPAKNDTGVGVAVQDGIDASGDYVTISASLPNQLAREMYYPDSETGEETAQGALTYNLVALIRQYPGSTYREILNLVSNAMSSQGLAQTPTAEGSIDRVVFGSTSGRRAAPIYPVCGKVKGKTVCSKPAEGPRSGERAERKEFEVTLAAGKTVGAMAGGSVAAYAPGTRELTGETGLIATGTILDSEAFRSRASITFQNAKVESLPENAQFVLISPFFSTERKSVAVDLPPGTTKGSESQMGSSTVLSDIADALKNSDYVSVLKQSGILENLLKPGLDRSRSADGARSWEIAVVAAPRKEFLELSGEPSIGKDLDRDVVFLIDRNGTPLYHFSAAADNASAAREVIRALELHSRMSNIRSLSNKTSSLSNKLLLKYVPVENISEYSVEGKCVVDAKPRSPAETSSLPGLKAGDRFYFEIINASSRELYIYMYSVAADGSITYFYPGIGAHERLPVGAVFRTYEANCLPFHVLENSLTGPESVKIIATTSPIQAEILESPVIGRNRRGRLSPLDALLTQAATNTRGDGPVPVDDWTTVDFEYVVVR